MKILASFLRAFQRDSRGNIIMEAVIFLPAMIFTYIGLSIAWDGYRATNLAQKATYTVADIISRETGVMRQTLMINYLKALGFAAEVPTAITSATMANAPVALRITSVLFDEADTVGGADQVTLQFSITSSTTQLPAHTATSLQAIKNRIPALQEGDNIIIVESRLKWTPSVSAEDATDYVNSNNNRSATSDNAAWFVTRNIETFTTVRPRFVPRLCWQVGITTSTCEL